MQTLRQRVKAGGPSYAAGKERPAQKMRRWMPMQREENKAQRFLRRCMCAVCALMFAFFILVFLLSAQGPAWCRLAWTAAFVCLLAGAAWLCRHFASFVAKYFSLLAGGAALAFFAAAVVFAVMLRFDPIYDLEAIYRGGEGWGVYGELMRFTSHTFDPNYFYRWHNNLGGAAFLAVYFKLVHALGCRDLFLAAAGLNAFLSALCIFVTAQAGRRLGGEAVGAVAALCLLFTPPMWFSAAVFYTDFLTILFPVLAFWLFLRGQGQKTLRKSAVWYLLAGLSAGLGAMLKPTVGIVTVAVIVILLLWRRPGHAAVFALCAALCVCVFRLALDSAVYPAQLDKTTAQRVNTPVLHWVMMGMQGDGGWNAEDDGFTQSFDGPVEKQRQVAGRLCQRLQAMDGVDALALLRRKMEKCFCNGTYDLHAFLDDRPQNDTALRHFLMPDSAGYDNYRHLCNGVEMGIFALSLLGSAALCVKKRVDYRMLVPPLCILGLAMFLCLWETNARYIVNYLPMLALCAAQGMRQAISKVSQ